MRRILGLLAALFAIAVIVVVTVPFLVSTEWIRAQATEAVREQTGRELIISGDTSFSVFPDISLTVTHATLSNPGGGGGDFADMEELDLGLKLMPLLAGRVEVDRLIVTRPVVRLVIDEEGKSNWSFAPEAEPATPAKAAETAPAAGIAGIGPAAPPILPAKTLPVIESIEIGEMRLVDGTVSYADLRSGRSLELSAIDASISMSSLDEPLEVNGTAVWQEEELSYRLALAEPRALATGTPSGTSLQMTSPLLRAAFTGSVAAKEALAAEGNLEVSSPSLKDLARWLGTLPPRVDGLGAFSLAATVTAGKKEIALSSASLSLDGANAEGGLLVSLAGAKPLIQATLAADRIDVNRYLAGGLGNDEAASAASGGRVEAAALPASDLPAEWGAEPINVDGLHAVDADVRLSTRELQFHDLRAGQSALAVTLRESILTVDLSELQLYEGQAAGKLTVNGAGEMPAIAASFNVDNVAARAILHAAAGLDWLEGRGRISGSLASRGLTERRLVEALNGEMKVLFTDGAIRGFNVAQMVRSLSDGTIFDWARAEEQRTDFSELSADFTVAKGIAQTDNLQMLGPLVRLNGVGVANLPGRSVDFRIQPEIVASLEGQGGETGLEGIEVPFTITGSWDRPVITPDLAAVLRDPDKVVDTIEKIGRSLDDLRKNGGNLEKALDGITGKDTTREVLDLFVGGGGDEPDGQGGGEPQSPSPITEDVFNQLLGR